MIRRPPTMISMTDADIQDVRALVAHQKAMYEGRKVVVHRVKKGTDQTGEGGQGSSSSSSSSSTAAGGGGGGGGGTSASGPPTTETTSNLTADDAATMLLRQMAERAEARAREHEERHRRLGIVPGRNLGS